MVAVPTWNTEVFEILISNLSVTVSLPPHVGHFLIHRLALDPPETRTRSGGTPTLLWCFCCSGLSLCRTSQELGELPGAKHRKGQGQTYHAPPVSEHLEAARLCLQVSWIRLCAQVAAFKMEFKKVQSVTCLTPDTEMNCTSLWKG